MREVLIIVDPEIAGNSQPGTLTGTTAQMVSALQQAVLQDTSEGKCDRTSPFQQRVNSVHVITASELAQKIASWGLVPSNYLLCPLTLHLPESLTFPGQTVFKNCRATSALRQTVEDWGYQAGDGDYWLPIVLTAKGPLYAEVIGKRTDKVTSPTETAGASDNQAEAPGYIQPIHLTDAQRQPLYELGYRLLRSLQAIPSVYLMQFGFKGQELWFDRLWPFPTEPAISSLNIQEPDLLTCHWRCLTNQPLRELSIAALASVPPNDDCSLRGNEGFRQLEG